MSSIDIPEDKVEQIRAILLGRVNNLCVLSREGYVVLYGRASTYHAKQLAQHHVVKMLGLRALVNEIEVKDGFTIGPFCTQADNEVASR